MSKSKHDKKAAVPEPAKNLSTVKEGRVTKPAQTSKAKSKDLAKQVATKHKEQEKKTKPVIKQPTPESDDDSEDDSDGTSSDDSDASDSDISDDSEEESVDGETSAKADTSKVNARVNGNAEAGRKAAPAVAGAEKAADAESDTDVSSEDDDDDSEVEVPKTNGAAKPKADAEDDDDDDDSEDDSEDEDEDDDDSDSEDDDDEDEEAKPEPISNKRKADLEPERAIKKAKAEANGREAKNLFIGNLSWNVDEEMLSKEFDGFGEIAQVRLMTDRNTGRSKGFGYVEFVELDSAIEAYQAKNGAMLDGRALNVDYATPRGDNAGTNSGSRDQHDRTNDRANRFGDKESPPSDTIFIGNLSFDATPDDVREAFEQFGEITRISLPTDRESGAIKGFGYCSFASVEESTAALNGLRGTAIHGRTMRLDFAQPRADNNSSPRGGGFSGGRGRGDFGGRGGGRGRGDFGGRGGGRGRGGFGGRGGRGGNNQSTNRGGFGDFSGRRQTFD